jgi:hypothetical protein
MGTVHRNGTPPKRLPWKKVQQYSDFEFNEALIEKWAREHLEGHMQYDCVAFQGSGKYAKTITFTAWFQTKIDAERFQKQWMK